MVLKECDAPDAQKTDVKLTEAGFQESMITV